MQSGQMWNVWRRGIVTSVSVRKKAALKRSLAAVDVASPSSALLDAESFGQNSMDTNFVLFPHLELAPLMAQLVREDRKSDLIANLVHRAVHVIECSDLDQRARLRHSLQTSIYSVVYRLISQSDVGGYGIFGIFNRLDFDSVVPKLHPEKKEMIIKLISQPLLRIATFNRDIVLDPNHVIGATGVDGFRSIMDLFLLDLRLLNGKNWDRLLDAMRSRKRGGVHFELVRVWMLVWDESVGIDSPPVKGSGWTMRRVLSQIIQKQSKDMLNALLAASGGRRTDLLTVCQSRHALTGMPKHPWANDIVEEWLIQHKLGMGSEFASVLTGPEDHLRLSLPEVTGQNEAVETESNKLEETVFLINSDSKLTRLKEQLYADAGVIGMSFVTDSVISISTMDASFVIDLATVNRVFCRFLIKKLLNADRVKVVYSLESLLDKLQSLLALQDGIHFSNVVDLRRGRIRRTLQVMSTGPEQGLEVELPGLIDPEPLSSSALQTRESVQHIFGRVSLSVLVEQYLPGNEHDRSLAFATDKWEYRPLGKELLVFAANDSRYLVRLEDEFRQSGFEPTEVLSYDPFL